MEDRLSTKEQLYNRLPVISPEDIEDESVIHHGEEYETLLVNCMIEALTDPGWVIATNDPSQSYDAKSRFRPPSDNLRKWIGSLGSSRESLQTVARGLIVHEYQDEIAMQDRHLIIRAFEKMSDKYPNLKFYRSSEFTADSGFEGFDFAPGDLEEAIEYYDSSHSRRRRNPVLVTIPFLSVVREYKLGNVQIGTEGSWWRNSIEIWNYKKEPIIDTNVWRLPSSEKEMQVLEQRIKDAEINLE